ncbi:MAG TPA: hypothetical protein VGK94_08510 [Candidatus Polarisedimenticolia bacterium]|jgi:hypothetical protein
MVEAVLIYRPGAGDPSGGTECRIVSTQDPEGVRAVARAAVWEVRREAEGWRRLDRQIAAVREADASRLDAVLRELIPGFEAS